MLLLIPKSGQKYAFQLIICISNLILTFEGFSQNVENELFIIKRIRKYREWCTENRLQGLVPLDSFISPLYAEVPYQTHENFTGQVLYRHHSFWVTEEAGIKLRQVQDSLKKTGRSLYFYDTYRPYRATVKMWKIVPDERYAANPAKGSGHNRGVAVDVSLADLATGKPLPMPTAFDNFSDTAHHDFMNLPDEILKNRALLKALMEHAGFKALDTEWWHYSLPEPKRYPLLDLKFTKLRKQ